MVFLDRVYSKRVKCLSYADNATQNSLFDIYINPSDCKVKANNILNQSIKLMKGFLGEYYNISPDKIVCIGTLYRGNGFNFTRSIFFGSGDTNFHMTFTKSYFSFGIT